MKLIVFAAAGLMLLGFLTVWLQTRIQYRIGSTHVKISCAGVTLRRIALTDIKRISKRYPGGLAEFWYSTMNPKHRLLTIQRHTGWRKFIVITPRNRYVFLNDLKNAIKRVKPETNVESLVEQNVEAEKEEAEGTGEANLQGAAET